MGMHKGLRSLAAMATLLSASLVVAGCFLAPGKFTSQLDLNRDGTFAYRYEGQIHMLAMDKLSEMNGGNTGEFVAECFDEDTLKDRPCTDEEIADQSASATQDSKEQAAMASAMMGGLDPSDPDAIAQFTAGLERQKGWQRVEYVGDGLFDVSFAIEGQLGHDFVFPTIEGFPLANHFVMVALRDDGTVRINAPAFGGQGGSNPMQGMLAGMAGAGGTGSDRDMPNLPELDGVFTIVTDGTIRANNTDEGPSTLPGRQQLSWRVTGRSSSMPTALIDLAR